MNNDYEHQQRYYINLAAPPTREPAKGTETYMRPVPGFNPSWFTEKCGIEFTEDYYEDIPYRLSCYETMKKEVKSRFPGADIGNILSEPTPDLLTGLFGSAVLDGLMGRHIDYWANAWPTSSGEYLTDEMADKFMLPDPGSSAFMTRILEQMDQIKTLTGRVLGYLNWQGVMNMAFRIRGQQIFMDMMIAKERAHRIFEEIERYIVKSVEYVYAHQRALGETREFLTIGNCTVNMVGPQLYEEFLLPRDQSIRASFKNFGIHNCAWTVTPYLELYSRINGVGYLDMGIDSDFGKARELFPTTRRNILYTSFDLINKSRAELKADLERISKELAPCDVGLPDIEADVPDETINFVIQYCAELSESQQVSEA